MTEVDGYSSTYELSIWSRIHIFINDFASNQKCVRVLTQVLHNLINSDEQVEELHTSNSNNHNFYVKTRFSDIEQIKVICQYHSPEENSPEAIPSFMQSMAQFEKNEEDDEIKFYPEPTKGLSDAIKNRDMVFKKMARFVILVPTDVSLTKVAKMIQSYLKHLNEPKKKRSERFDFSHRFDPKRISSMVNYRIKNATRLFRMDPAEEIDNNDEPYFSEEEDEMAELVLKKSKKADFSVKFMKSDEELPFDMDEPIEQLVKRRTKMCKPTKSYLKIFKRQKLEVPNLINFTIEDPKSAEELKDEENEEDLKDDSGKSSKEKRRKPNRTYSLYMQKQQKSLQDRELERLINKDIRLSGTSHEEIGDSSKLFELLKFLFLLKESNFKNMFEFKSLTDSFRLNANVLNTHKFKSLFTNSKINSLLRKYLLTKHHSDCISKKDEALVEFVQHFPMVYEFKTRILFFKLTAFTSIRNKYFASELFTRAITRDEGGISISRRKIEVSRSTILEDSFDRLKDFQKDDSFLEFQFENEVGSGLGPTLEYYALIGKAIKEEPDMWKDTSDNTLYPNPLNFKKRSGKEKKRIEKFFELIGTVVARSLMDERLVDLPISVVFWKLVFSETAILDDVEKIDKSFYKGLKMIQDMIDKSAKLPEIQEGDLKSEMDYDQKPNIINTDWECEYPKPIEPEIDIEDLCLSFTLPGSENIDLVRNGYKKSVIKSNMKEYIRCSLNCLFNDSIKIQVNAFRRGINNVFRMDALKCFLFEELEGLIGGDDSLPKGLLEHVVPDHGYDKTSPTFLNFIKYMEEMEKEEVRNFLMFITGSPRLPLGGLKNLRPKLTVVKINHIQNSCNEQDPDKFLPSVMTCQNYVKLPDYSSFEVLKAKMDYAVKEGVNSFNLS